MMIGAVTAGKSSGKTEGDRSVSGERDAAGGKRDVAGERRDLAADDRDLAADERDLAAERSETSGRAGIAPEMVNRLARARLEAASDRRKASRDRKSGASERSEAEASHQHAELDDVIDMVLLIGEEVAPLLLADRQVEVVVLPLEGKGAPLVEPELHLRLQLARPPGAPLP